MKIDKTRTPDLLYDELPEEERTIALILREIIFETIEVKKEKLAWGAPFYYGKKQICFVWPASVPWGKLKKGVALGFTRGRDLSDQAFFDQEGRQKQIARKVFFRPEEIDIARIQEILLEAEQLDRER